MARRASGGARRISPIVQSVAAGQRTVAYDVAMDAQPEGVDLSPLHREIDALKRRLCRCGFTGECIACRGFEVIREQTQMVVAAASQPVLMQVAQEASVKDLMAQLGGVSQKLMGDPELQELVARMMERVEDDLGGPEAMQQLLRSLPGFPGGQAGPAPDDTPPGTRE